MVFEGDGVEGDCGAGDVDGANLQVAGGQAREVDVLPGVRHTQQRQAEQKGRDHPYQAQGVHEQYTPYQVVPGHSGRSVAEQLGSGPGPVAGEVRRTSLGHDGCEIELAAALHV